MRIALTGASGYVGRTLLQALRKAGHDTHAWSRRECPAPWHRYDLAPDPHTLPWEGCDALIHAAHDFTARDDADNLRLNIKPSVALLRTARQAGVRRLIFISSLSSFDGTRSTYGRTKLAIEKECLAHGGMVIRPGLVWGDHPGGVMGALERIVTRLPVVPCLTGPRGLPQYLIHEQDLANTVLHALGANPPPTAHLIEAACPNPLPIREILTRIARRQSLHRLFPPLPWQVAMACLKTAEALSLNSPFRSDSLTGLVYGIPSLQSDPSHPRRQFRPFV